MHQQFPPGRCLSSRRDAGSALHDPRVPCGMLQSLTPQHPHRFFISFAFFFCLLLQPAVDASAASSCSSSASPLSKSRGGARERDAIAEQIPTRSGGSFSQLLLGFSWHASAGAWGKKKKVWHGTVERLPNLDLRLSFSVLFQDP